MASGKEHLTGMRWFVRDTIDTAKEAARLYFAPLVWIRDFFRGMAALADRAKSESAANDELSRPAEIVSDEEFDFVIQINRRTEQALRALLSEMETEHLERQLDESLRDVLKERDAIVRMRDQLNRFRSLQMNDLLRRMPDSPMDRPLRSTRDTLPSEG